MGTVQQWEPSPYTHSFYNNMMYTTFSFQYHKSHSGQNNYVRLCISPY